MAERLCGCGCRQLAPISRYTDARYGAVKGEPLRYIRGHNNSAPLLVRLFSRLIIDPAGCLLWEGPTDSDGYGHIKIAGRTRQVHRVMYEMFVGPVPDGLELDHVKARGCTNRNCASPAHLEPVTGLENKLRADGIIAAHVAATHCPQNHRYDETNTYVSPDGRRGCRACRNKAARLSKARKKAAA